MKRNIYLFYFLFGISCTSSEKKKATTKSISEGRGTTRIERLQFVADSLYANDNYNGSKTYYDTLINLDSTNGEYFFRRAYSYEEIYQKPRSPESIRDYLKALKLNYHKSVVYHSLALSYLFVKDSVALYYLEKSYEEDPNDALVLLQIAQCKERLAKNKKM